MTAAELAALRALVEAMTPGPWRAGDGTGEWPARYASPTDIVMSHAPAGGGEWIAISANGNFTAEGRANIAGIVALRNAAPSLLAVRDIGAIELLVDALARGPKAR